MKTALQHFNELPQPYGQMDTCAKYEDTPEGNTMINLMNSISGFNFFAGEVDLFYGLDEQLDTCVWSAKELKAFPEVRLVSVSEMIAVLKAVLDGSGQLELGL